MTDTTCISSRWIALSKTEENKDIFMLDSSFDSSLDLVYTIKSLVDSNQLNIYRQFYNPHGNKRWYYIDYQKEKEELLKDSMSLSKQPYFEIVVEADVPLVNIDGYDSTIIEDGRQVFVYPTPFIYVYPARKCDEIRIKETRVFNDSTQTFEFVPVGLSFYFKGRKYSSGYEKFWIDLNEFFAVLEDKEKYPWYQSIINKEYQGFQYMQVSCYDHEIKY